MNAEPLTKAAARKILGLPSDYALAKFFKIRAQSVFKWPEDGPIPPARELELRRTRPELFQFEQADA